MGAVGINAVLIVVAVAAVLVVELVMVRAGGISSIWQNTSNRCSINTSGTSSNIVLVVLIVGAVLLELEIAVVFF